MPKVRSIADLLLLMFLISMACPNFGNHDFMPLDVSCFDHHSRIDPVTFIGMCTCTVVLKEDPVPVTALVPPCSNLCTPVSVRALAMPCSPVTPRRKP
eukprot:15752561-Heterocapsa_arctica.AAC.1